MDVAMPTLEAIKNAVQMRMGVAFLPRMVVEPELDSGRLKQITVKELKVERNIRLAYPVRRQLSHAARAFLEMVRISGTVKADPEPATAQ